MLFRKSSPLEPRTWTQVLNAERLAFVTGSAERGLFVAGHELWQQVGPLFVAIPNVGNQWRTVCASSQAVWAVGQAGAVAKRTTDGWIRESFGRQTGIHIGAWGDTAWVSVSHGEIHRRVDGRWSSWKPDALSDHHTGVLWGASADDVCMHTQPKSTGKPPTISHWDGAKWSLHPLSRPGYLANIHGNQSDNVWAVGWTVKWLGKGPLAAHWDGQRWTEVQLPTQSRLTDVHVCPDGTVWISGLDGTLLRGQNGVFTPIQAPEGTLSSVYARDQTIWVIVDGSRLMRSDPG